MASVRKILTAEEYNALAATPLPFVVIWSEQDFEAFMKRAERGATMTYLGYLLEYQSTLLENNPIYNDVGKTAKQVELLEALPKYIKNLKTVFVHELEVYAAALNLYALLLKDTKDLQAARETLQSALQIENLSLLSQASLLHTLATVYSQEKNPDARLTKLTEAVELLEKFEESYEVDKHITACIYSSYADAVNYKSDMVKALGFHMRAIVLWPQNNVIANHAAIFFSKQNTLLALQKAEEIFAKFYDKAKEKKIFVTPFYRADVNIKLAGQAKQMGDDKLAAEYLKHAREYLLVALAAIKKNYTGSYQSKGMARLEYLEANLAYVEGRFLDVSYHKAKAAIYRQEVDEPREKFDKFMAKFPEVPEPSAPEVKVSFSTMWLYRRKPALQPAAAEAKTEIRLTL